MTLTLRAVSLNEQPLTQPITAHFDAKGGTIGRADNNLMALPDPERHISRQQAQISQAGAIYRIKNIGSANPIHVRGQPLGQGESAPLAHRDHVRIGGYLLEVSEDVEDDVAAHTILRGRAAIDARVATGSPSQPLTPRSHPGGANPLSAASASAGEMHAPLSSSNPFADLLGPATPAPRSAPLPPPAAPLRGAMPITAPAALSPAAPSPPPLPPSPPKPMPRLSPPPRDNPFADLMPAPAGIPSSSPAFASAAPAAPRLPDDFDPFAPPPAAPAKSPRANPFGEGAPRARAGEFDDLIPSSAPSSIDDLFGLGAGGARDPLANFMADVKPAAAGGEPLSSERISTDPLALFGDAAAAAAPVVPTLPDHTPALREAYAPPKLATARDEPAAAPRPSAVSDGDAAALWQAFCEGAGIRPESQAGLSPELMQMTGALLRAAVDGCLQLMAVRAATKHEMRAQVTVIQARNNNPLKFSPDAQSALEQLLQPPLRGFLDGPAAMTDAMHDLVGHSIGTMAGMRAALEGVLDRFSPQALEAKLSGKTVLDALLPRNRKAKLWELYLQHAQGIRSEAQDDFETLFGKAFLAAYEQQLDRLKTAAQAP